MQRTAFTREFDYQPDHMLKTIAYHEAGHYMIGELILRLIPEFTDLEGIMIRVDSNSCSGIVKGVLPPTNNIYDMKGAKTWLRAERRRSLVCLLSSLAGDVTNRVFVEKNINDYILRFFQEDDGTKVIRSFSLAQGLRLSTDAFATHQINDCDNALQYCSLAGIHSHKLKLDVCHIGAEVLHNLMMNRAIQHGISNMKNYLLRENLKLIEGRYLRHVRSRVNELTKRVNFSFWLDLFERRIDQRIKSYLKAGLI